MPDTTPTDIAALEAEVAALEAEHAATAARIDALLSRPVAPRPVTTRERLDALWAGVAQLERDSAVQERYQRRIARAIDAL
jgi:BMFP domain-containing protein YqiC